MKILVVSPFFPPHSSVAVIRISSLIRSLLKKKHNITVLTNELGDIKKHTKTNSELKCIKRIKVDINQNNGKYFKNRDSYIEAFNEVMNKEHFDIVLITAGPFYTLPLVKISKKVFNTKCIIDFRDLWVFDIRNLRDYLAPKNIFKKMVFFFIELEAIKYSDKVVTVTDGWANILQRVYPRYKNKIKVIYNGFDNEYMNRPVKSIKKPKAITKNGFFNLIVFGKLAYYSESYTSIFFRSLKTIVEQYNNIQLIQIGSEEARTAEIINKIDFPPDKFINTGFVDYREGMSYLEHADVTVIIDIRKNSIGTKIYDYIYVNKPILYIGKKNTYLSRFVSSFENGFSCQTEKDIVEALIYIKDNNIKSLTSSKQSYSRYSRKYQNEKFLQLLENELK